MRTRPRGGYRIARLLTQALLMVVAYIGFIVYTTPIVAAQSSTTGACIKAASTYDNCTANDTGFGAFTVINVTDGCTSPSDTFTAEIKAEVISTGQTKYDVGMWINLDGTDAINGNSCYRQILSPGVASPYPGLNLTGGNGPFRIEDGDSCGDIRQNESNFAQLQPLQFACSDANADGMADINGCVSWAQSADSIACSTVNDALPGTGSKCRCDTFTVAVSVPNLSLTKSCVPDQVAPGGTVVCTITYRNSGHGDAVGFSLVDNYDQSQGAVSNIGTTNPGSNAGADNGDTITWQLPTVPKNGGAGSVTYEYTVNANVAGNSQIQNTATIYYGSTPQAVATQETITVVRTGSIRIAKATDPAGWPGSFAFTSNSTPATFSLADGGSQLFTALPAGVYTLAETPLAGWSLSNLVCTGATASVIQIGTDGDLDAGDTGVAINLAAGENVVCTFTNAVNRGRIIVAKKTAPAGLSQGFTFTTDYGAPFTLSDGQSADSGALLPGSYSVGEALPAGWVQESVVCSDGSNAAAIELASGETVTCTFTNRQQLPGIGIDKSANQVLINGGTSVVYSYLVTNQGEAPLSSVTVSDDKCAPVTAVLTGAFNTGDSDQDGFLESGEAWRYTCTSTITQDTTNIATVTAATPFGTTVSASDSAFVDVRPIIAIEKSASPTSVPETGGDVQFTVVVSNPSSEAVTIKTLTDSIYGDLNGQGTCSTTQTIAIGGSYTCTFTHWVGGDYPSNHTNVVTARATDDEGNVATANDNAVVTFTDVKPAVTLVKTVAPVTLAEPGGVFTFTLTIVNTSLEPATITALTDSYPLSASCLALVNTTLGYNEAATCTYTVTRSAPGSYTNTATVTVNDGDGNSATGSDNATFTVTDLPSALRVTKSATPTTLPEPGGPVVFTVQVTNLSAVDTVTLNTITDDTDNDGVVDLSFAATAICNTVTLAPGASAICTFPTRTISGNAGDLFTDVAAVTATDDDGQPVSGSNDATVTLTGVGAQIGVSKSALPTSVSEPGGLVEFTVRVVNQSTVDLVTINQLIDSIYHDITTSGHDGIVTTTCRVPQTLTVNGGNYSCTFIAPVAGNFGENHLNTVVATGIDDDNESVSGSAQALVTIVNTPAYLAVRKSANRTQVPESGGDVTFAVAVQNISAVDVITVTQVVDDQFGDVSSSCQPSLPVRLAPGNSLVCTFTRFLQGDAGTTHTNVATANGIDDDKTPVTGSDNAVVTFTDTPATLAVSKAANPTTIPESGGVVQFTVRVTNTSAADNITVNTVNDTVFGNVSSSCVPALPVDLAPGGVILCTFTRFFSGDEGTPHQNIATASGVDDDGAPVSGSGTATVPFTDTPAVAQITKTADRLSVPDEGGEVVFTVQLQNNSTVDSITFATLQDSIYGNVATTNPQLLNSTCVMPQTLGPDALYTCQFTAFITGAIGDVHRNVLTATGVDDDGDAVTVNDDAIVTVADPLISATKSATLATDQNGDGVANPGDVIGYTIVVRNSGNAPGISAFFNDLVDVNGALVVGSVTTSQGTVVSGNSTGQTTIAVDIGALASQSAVTIRFQVRIDNPLPLGVTRIVNQGLISGTNFPTVPTDDPETPTPDDPTITPVVTRPLLNATKSAALAVDADQNGMPSPGDTLEYRIAVVNSGDQAAMATFVNDQLDPNVTLLVGSVQSSQGQVLVGNNAGDTSVQVEIGTIPGNGGTVMIVFRVGINNPLLATVVAVVNQAQISGQNTPVVLTDDPTTPTGGDPTITSVVAEPLLRATKRAQLWIDADENGAPSPGDTLLYLINIFNIGNREATGVSFTDTPDVNTTLVVGSVQPSPGAVVRGNNAGDNSVAVTISNLAGGGGEAVISYRVTINAPFPAGVAMLKNQGIVASDDLPDLPTDDPTTLQPGDPTQTPVLAQPLLVMNKVDILAVDADNNNGVSANDILLYQITIVNRGNATALDVILNDQPDANTTLQVGTVQTDRGVIVRGNNAGDTSITVNIGALPPGESAVITFKVKINANISVSTIENQAVVSLSNPQVAGQAVSSDDPDSPKPDDATITPIVKGPTALEAVTEPTSQRMKVRIFLPLVAQR